VTAYLLDTNIALLALSSPSSIPGPVRQRIEATPRSLSVISFWEVLLKSMKGKLEVGDPRAWWLEALQRLSATPLPLRAEHVAEIYSLSPIHQDPFDRALIGQAKAERLTIVTTDAEIARYPVECLRVQV